jgi:uncharacterized protein with HEPN domain
MKTGDPGVLLDQMMQAAQMASSFVEGLEKDDFLKDARTQQAVAMGLLTIGEMVSRLTRDHAGFLERHPDASWSKMRGMRNRIAHGYFELDFEVVWDTVLTELPKLIYRLSSIREAAARDGGSPRSPEPTDNH